MSDSAMRRLTRSSDVRAIAGVCGGLAKYLAIDVTIVRVLFVVFAFAGGAAIPVYVVLWILMPEDGTPGAGLVVGERAGEIAGAVLIVGGIRWLLANFGVFAWVQWSVVWPLALVALGVLILVRGVQR